VSDTDILCVILNNVTALYNNRRQ